MYVSTLIEDLQQILDKHGDLKVILQADPEGNSYDTPRGAVIGYVDSDMEYCYESEEQATEDGNDDVREIVVIYP